MTKKLSHAPVPHGDADVAGHLRRVLAARAVCRWHVAPPAPRRRADLRDRRAAQCRRRSLTSVSAASIWRAWATASAATPPIKARPFAGGLPIATPFGTIYTPNITSDPDTGIGHWTDADFLRAMHEGIGKDGERLYPAFPYAEYTKVTDQDVLAIRAYLNRSRRSASRRRATTLRFRSTSAG